MENIQSYIKDIIRTSYCIDTTFLYTENITYQFLITKYRYFYHKILINNNINIKYYNFDKGIYSNDIIIDRYNNIINIFIIKNKIVKSKLDYELRCYNNIKQKYDLIIKSYYITNKCTKHIYYKNWQIKHSAVILFNYSIYMPNIHYVNLYNYINYNIYIKKTYYSLIIKKEKKIMFNLNNKLYLLLN